jgi:hypothetical protein
MVDELRFILEEAAMACLKMPSWNLPGWAEEYITMKHSIR